LSMEPISLENYYYMLHPRPVVLIVTLCPNGRVNVMPASWVTPVNDDPPVVAVAVSDENYTSECLRYCREATLNIPSEDMADLVYSLGTVSGREVDKVSRFNLKLVDSRSVKPPYIDGSLGVIEARVRGEVGVDGVTLFLLDVVAAYAKKGLFSRWGWDVSKARLLLHGAGRAFYTIGRRVWATRKG